MTSCDRARGGRRSLERALEPPGLVVQWRWAAGGGGRSGKRATTASRRQRLVHALLLSLLGALLLLANAGRPLLTPASCLQLSAPTAGANASRSPGASSPPVARTTRAQDDEEAAAFSRAVMATMSTQSSVPARPLLARASEPGAAERQSADTAPIYAPDGELGGAEAPTTPVGIGGGGGGAAGDDEVESSDDLVVSGRRAGAALHEEPLRGEPLDSGATGAGALPGGLNSSANGNANGNANGANGELTQVLDGFTDFARIFAMVAIMIGDICGNSLVILSVVRHSKLRVTTNWFVVSLACADILVALFAMTFNASVQITGRWIFPRWMCDFWNSCDVLASTASILHLCCISIDRYYAIMRPLDYPMKITTRRVCYALAVVWFSSALLSYIPIFTGVYTTSEHIQWQQQNPDQCEFVVNRVYAIVSSSISFWIPCCIMVFTYYKIYQEATRQEKFIYKAQSMMPAPQPNHHHHQANSASGANRSKQRRSKSMAITSLSSNSSGRPAKRTSNEARIKQFAAKQAIEQQQAASSDSGGAKASGAELTPASAAGQPEQLPLTGSATDINNNNNNNSNSNAPRPPNQMAVAPAAATSSKQQQQQQQLEEQDERDSNSGQSTPTKRSISKMKREHKAAKTLGIIMGVFILCWLPFFSWYTPQHICGHACDGIIPHNVVTLLFWIGYFNSTLNPIIYAYFNHEFRDAFKKTLQWLFCCCRDLKCLRVSRPNDNQHYNCTYRSTQEIGLVTNG